MKTILLSFFLITFLSVSAQVKSFKSDLSKTTDTSSYPFKRMMIKNYANYVNEDSTDYESAYLLSNLYFEVKEYEKSIPLLTYLIKQQPENENPVTSRGFAYMFLDSLDLAVADFDQCLKLDSTNAINYLNRAYLLTQQDKYQLAINDLTKAISYSPYYTKAYCNRGYNFNKLELYDTAIFDLKKAIKLNPKYTEAVVNLGDSYLYKAEYKLAIENYDLALKQNKSIRISDFYFRRGTAQMNLGKKEEAKAEFTKSINYADTDSLTKHLAQYEIFNIDEKYDSALIELNKALVIKPKEPKYYDKRAELYLKLKKKRFAKRDNKKAAVLRENE